MRVIIFLILTLTYTSCSLLDEQNNSSKNLKKACSASQILYYSNCNSTNSKLSDYCKNAYMQCTYICGFAATFGCGL